MCRLVMENRINWAGVLVVVITILSVGIGAVLFYFHNNKLSDPSRTYTGPLNTTLNSSAVPGTIPRNTTTAVPGICVSEECIRIAADIKEHMDRGADPCHDFLQYVCGNRNNTHPHSERNSLFQILQEQTNRNIRAQLETNISRSDPKPVAQAKTMYQACINKSAQKRDGLLVVAKYLKEVGLPRVPTLLKTSNRKFEFDWILTVAKIQRKFGINVLLGFNVVPDYSDKYRNRLTLGYCHETHQEHPKHDWSEQEPETTAKIYNNDGDGNDFTEEVLVMVKKINPRIDTNGMRAKISTWAPKFNDFVMELLELPESNEDDRAYYSVQELQNITDKFIAPRNSPLWQRFLDILFSDFPSAKPTTQDKLQISRSNVDFLSNLSDIVSKQPPEIIELYVWMRASTFLVHHYPNGIDTPEQCAKKVMSTMDLAVSYLILDKNFLVESKPRIKEMLRNIKSGFIDMVSKADWIDANTKNALLEKSNAMKAFIGLPEWVLDVKKLQQHYQALQVSENDMENWFNVLQFQNANKLRLWRKRTEQVWNVDQTEVTASFFQRRNAINIPVAIIQNPFYHLGLQALNYGALGVILGHELIHGFDNTGSHLDKSGDYKPLLSNDTLREYYVRADCFVRQYSGFYDPVANRFINGSLTLNENIADNGGLQVVLRAYRVFEKQNGTEQRLPGLEDLTPEELFFISFTKKFCGSILSFGAEKILEDVHPPPKFRVQAVLSNMKEFAETFHCPTGTPMNPEHKCRLW